MAVVAHALKLFFSAGFVSAAVLQSATALAHGLDARGLAIDWPPVLSHQDSSVVISAACAAVLTTVLELRRRSDRSRVRL